MPHYHNAGFKRYANLASISKTYAHAIKTVDEKAADAIGDILNPTRTKEA